MRYLALLCAVCACTSVAHPTKSDSYIAPAASFPTLVQSSWTAWTTSQPHYTNGTAFLGSSSTESIQATTSSCYKPVPSQFRLFPLTAATPAPSASPRACPEVQYKFSTSSGATDKANAVRDAYVRSWNQYGQYCFGQDSLFITNKTCTNDFGGWGVTIVDSLDTAIIMNLTDIVESQLAHIVSIDFTISNAPQPVSAFETTIRYLGGLLSGYDLLTSTYAAIYDQTQVDALLTQAVILADQLNFRFDTPTGLPAESLYWGNKTYPTDNLVNSINNQTYNASNAAVCGTIILEYYRLSDLTGNAKYRALADRAEQYLVDYGSEYQPAYGNLVGSQLDIDRGNYLTYDFGWKAGIDSFWEVSAEIPSTSSD